jgi:type VI secretion system protein ImpM
MRCSLFGKLGAKRDFIALATPRRFLETWEPWVQACMSASRHQLGKSWQNAFLTAPVWRFWLGADITGATVLGAIMPSVDGVGRYFPLTLMAAADPSYSVPPPDLNAQDQWFAVVEDFLLSTLDQARSFDDISTALEALPAPLTEATIVGGSDGIVAIGDTMVGIVTAGKTFQDSLLMLRRSNHESSAAASFWWTEGGGNFPPMALCSRGMPDPFRYSGMLTGRLTGDEIESAS